MGTTGTHKTAEPCPTRKAQVIEVIKTESLFGDGTEGDPVRIVTQYWTLAGTLLAKLDPGESLEG